MHLGATFANGTMSGGATSVQGPALTRTPVLGEK